MYREKLQWHPRLILGQKMCLRKASFVGHEKPNKCIHTLLIKYLYIPQENPAPVVLKRA